MAAVTANATKAVAFGIEDLLPLDALAAEWRALEGPTGPFFTTWNWIGTWLRTLPATLQPHLIRATREGRTTGLAIGFFHRARRHVFVNARQLHLNSTGDRAYDCITIEHNDFVGEPDLLPLFADWFSQADCADELVVSNVSARISRGGDLLFSLQEKPAFANARLAEIGEAGVGTLLSRNARQHLNRSMRDFARYGALRVDEARTSAEAFEFFGGLKVLHRRSWDRRRIPHAFRKPYFETFHRSLIAGGALGTQIQLLRISAGNHVLGYLYNFRSGTAVYAYQSGFADESKNERPGYVSHALAMEYNAGQGCTRYDFLAGDNRLKRSFGEPYEMPSVTFGKPTTGLRTEAFLRSLRSHLSV